MGIHLFVVLILLAHVNGASADIGAPIKDNWNLTRILETSFSKLKLWANVQDEVCRDYSLYERREFETYYGPYSVVKVSDRAPDAGSTASASEDFAAEVNINFVPEYGVTYAQAREFRQKVNRCYRDAGTLRDSKGNGLHLFLADPKTSGLSQIHVKLTGQKIRESAREYSLESSCPTILHEGLHLLGLWDEYAEPGYHCRALGNSIMSDHSDVHIVGIKIAEAERIPIYSTRDYFVQNSQIRFLEVGGVDCSSPENRAKLFFSSSKRSDGYDYEITGHFSDGTRSYGRLDKLYIPETTLNRANRTQYRDQYTVPDQWVSGFLKLNPSQWICRASLPEGRKYKVQTGQELAKSPLSGRIGAADLRMSNPRWPLKPAHFRKIAYRNCRTKNFVYDLCTSETYTPTSPNSSCQIDRFPACRNGEWLN